MKYNYIGIIANDGPELAVGLLGILKSGNSFVPISPAYPNDRIDFIIKDCGIRALLTDRANYEKAQQVADNNSLIKHLLCIDDQMPEKETREDIEKKRGGEQKVNTMVTDDDPCYLIYTSGSTGKPKGVPITHRNLIPLFSWFREYFDLGTHTRVMQNLSYTFDFGVFEILTTLVYGGCLYLLDKGTIGEFAFYSKFINRHLINTVHSTPVFFSNLVSAAEEMPSLQLVHLGGERLTGKIVKNISRLVPPGCLIHNGYGPTEATINCSIFTLTAARAAEIEESIGLPIGHPTAWNILYILDKYNNPQPSGAAGELCVAGPGLSQGYLNRPELTAEKFLSISYRSYKSYMTYISKKIYKTGDLSRWLPEGNIEFLGRIDFQVKVRGFRIELGEIENHLLKHPDIREAVVLAREHENGSHYLCAYFVTGTLESPSVTRLREHLAADLPDYMIPAYFILLEEMPLTTTGKVDRKSLPEPDESTISTGVAYAAPQTTPEKNLVKIWQGLLKREKIGIMDDFFELGGDSILANQCIARIREELEAEVPLRKFFERPYIKALAGEIAKKQRRPGSISRASRDGLIPLSFAQERLWFLQELDTENVAYFVPRVIRIKGKIEKELFERTFSEIIRRHEILRTRFLTVDGLAVQHIDPPYEFKIPVIDWSKEEESKQEQEVTRFLEEEGQRLFDFEIGPLLRVTLLKLNEDEHLFVLTEHHLIHDGWTQGVLLKEFIEIFTAFSQRQSCPLPELPIQYADFAVWQRQFLQGEVLTGHLEYWKKKLTGAPPVLEIPGDRPRPPVISGKGAMKPFYISPALTAKLKDFGRKHNTTLFMTMLAVFKIFLYRYTGAGDLCVGTGIANRRYKEMEGMLGMVINTLPLRTSFHGDLAVQQLLHRVRETCLEAYQHEDTPFGKIVEIMQPERSLSYTPLFQVLFGFMDTPTGDLHLPGLELQLLESHNRSSKFDINVVVVPPPEPGTQEQNQQQTGEILVEWEYNTDIFAAPTIDRMICHYTRLLEEILQTPEKSLSALPMLSAGEIQQLLFAFNETAADYPCDKTIDQLFAEQAERHPDNVALLGVHETHEKHKKNHYMSHMSYKELNKKSHQLACLLRQKGVLPDTIVGIIVERSLEMIVAVLGILKAGGAYLPIDQGYPQERIVYMLKDSNARILLKKSEIRLSKFETNSNDRNSNDQNERTEITVLNFEHLDFEFVSNFEFRASNLNSSNLAYIIYTSGSTGQAKGVLTTHSNVNRVVKNTNYINIKERDRLLQLSNYAFDGSVFDIYGALTNGAALIMVKPEELLAVDRLAALIKREAITLFFVTTALFNMLVELNVDCFSFVRKILFGGERVSVEHSKKALAYLGKNRIIHVYGPTETTVYASYYFIDDVAQEAATIPIGKPISNTTAFILDRNLKPVPIGVHGEIYIGGPGLARGYLNRPELTAEKFGHDLWDLHDCHDEKNKSFCRGVQGGQFFQKAPPLVAEGKKLYKTGDLARWLFDGNIEFLGRIDSQVKIRGFRIELGEIENQLLNHQQVKEVVVIDYQEGREKYLCAYIVSGPGSTPGHGELKNYLENILPVYMIPAFFIPIEKIPLTPNGKVDRKALPIPGTTVARQYTPPRNLLEERLAQIWAEVLVIKSKTPLQTSIGIDDNFFDLGGHSLNATIIIARIQKALKIKIPVAELFKSPSIRELAQYMNQSPESQFNVIQPAEKKEYYPLSAAQKRLYILYQMDDIGTTYNIPTMQMLEGAVDKDRLAVIFKKLVERHESFRTSFIEIDEEPVQRIHNELEFEMEYYSSGREGERETGNLLKNSGKQANREIGNKRTPLSLSPCLPELIKNFIRPFDISFVPLLRVGLVKMAHNRHLLMLDMHHIISDGTSHNIVVKELITLYRGEELPVLPIQYKDYSQWKSLTIGSESLKHQESYWKSQFQEEIPVLNLPLDYPRPSTQGFAGNRVHFEITAGETNALKQVAHEQGATLYMVLLAVLNVFLSKITLQEDIIIGTPIAARRHADLEPVIGMFVNTLALRNYPTKEKTFAAFLKEVKERTLSAYENQDYPFETLVEVLALARDASRNPLFDVLFALQNMESYPVQQLQGLKITPYPYENRTSKFDLYLSVLEKEETLALTLEYSTRLFRKDTILRITGFFTQVIAAVIKNPHLKLEEIEIINEREKEKILQVSQGIKEPVEKHRTIHGGFEEKASASPGRIALAFKEEQLTYGELNRRANQLASLLRSKGVGVDTVVGLMVERSIEIVIGILAIMKAGGAYLPIDTAYPEVRKTYMLQDSGVNLLLVNDEIENFSHAIPGTVETLDIRSPQLYREETDSPEYIITGDHLLYVIYTSGSTGNPKGIMMQHSNLLNLLQYQFKYTNIPLDRVLQFTTISFDVSFQEIYSTLLAGGTLFLIDNETRGNVDELFKVIEKHVIGTLFLPASFLKSVLNEEAYLESMPRVVRHIVTAGEQVIVSPRLRGYLQRSGVWLHNHYGPAETHVVTTLSMDPVEEIPELPSIGQPIQNTGIYILDRQDHLQPVGVPGEVVISGIQVGRGYLNRPELTAQRFLSITYKSYTSYKTYISKKIYKTGDLARWLADGSIEFLGRMDYQVKIRGFRIEMGEIEHQLLAHPAVKEAVVIDRERGNREKYLCAYITIGLNSQANGPEAMSGIIINELKQQLSNTLPDYMVPTYFVILEKIPLTPNGKVDRKALPVPALKTDDEYTAPTDKTGKKLAGIWAEVLGIEPGAISIDVNFFELGGHSLKATILISRIHKQLNVKIPLVELFRSPTIRGLSRYIAGAVEENYTGIEPAEKKEYYPLSAPQKRLFILEQISPNSIAYNMPQVLISEEPIDCRTLEQSFKKLIQRHESLRTSFHMIGGQPVQKIHAKNYKFQIPNYKQIPNSKSQITNIIDDFIHPFDLSQAPLLRVGLIKTQEKEHILMVDLHHIVTDGTSQDILTRDLMTFYSGGSLSQLQVQYKDYAQWQGSEAQQAAIKEQASWWWEQYRDRNEVHALDLPTDYPRPPVQGFEGDRLEFVFDEKETNALKSLASQEGATLFMVLLAVFNVFLSRISGKENIIVGTPTAGRRLVDIKPVVGMFVNTLALRNYPRADTTYRDFLHQVRENTLQAFENQEYPFEELVERLSLERDTGRSPLFDVVFTLQNMSIDSSNPGFGQSLKPYPYRSNVSKFDMTFAGTEKGGRLAFIVEYSTRLFKAGTILRFIEYFREIIAMVLAEPAIKLPDIEIISEDERRQILVDFNNTATDYPRDKTIHELFLQQVEQTPDQIALVAQSAGRKAQGEKRRSTLCAMHYALSYKKLNEKSHQLACQLQAKGAQPGDIVGIIGERSLQMVIGILGILKTGGAYLPIDADYPEERINYMLADSRVNMLVTTDSKFNVQRSTFNVFLDGSEALKQNVAYSTLNIEPGTLNNHLAYIMYTSGSTGRPKGVMVGHRSVVRLVKKTNFVILNPGTRILQTGAPVFDATTFEIWGSLLNGGQLVLVHKNVILDSLHLGEALAKYAINTLWLSSPLFNRLAQENSQLFSPLHYLLVGGDVLSPAHINTVKKEFPALSIINGYGPTENTTFSTTFLIRQEFEENIPIGKPIANSTAYIVDQNNHLQPIGIVGELMVGGDGVAHGYLNNPELTFEMFCLRRPGALFEKTAPGPRKNFLLTYSPIYRTGDLARWLADGNIEFLGRRDQQVKIRGFRIEPEEIEKQILFHPAVKETVVIARQTENTDEDKYLCAYMVPTDDSVTSAMLKEHLSGSLPDYMIPLFFVFLDKIPLTANGKIDRKALPAPEVGGIGEDFAGPRDELERQLAKVWAEILNLDWEAVGIDADFFDLGGHSLKAVTITAQIHRLFDVKIPLVDFFNAPTIRTMGRYIREAAKTLFTGLENVEKKEYYPLSFNQRRLYFIHQMEPQSPAYNMPAWLKLPAGTDKKVVENVLKRLMERHESLRTRIAMKNNEPVQLIAPPGKLPLPLDFIDISSLEERDRNEKREEVYNVFSTVPFDLELPPLFRSVLVKLSSDHYEIMFNLHHIISDGWSLEVLEKEFNRVYEAYTKGNVCHLEPLTLQYKDYTYWQNRLLADDESVARAKAFWKKYLSGNLSLLPLPYDMPPSPATGKESASYSLVIPESLTLQLRQLAQDYHASLFMVLLAGFNLLLSRVTGQMDIMMAIPAAARQHEDLKNIIGMFVNTLILRNTLNAEDTFLEFFQRLQTNTLQVLEYQSYPMELICSELAIKYPDISVFFNMVNIGDIPQENLDDSRAGHSEKVQEAKFDWVFYLREYKNGIRIDCHYFKELFIPKTIEKIMHLYLKVLERVSDDPGEKIGAYNLTGKRRELKRQ